MSYNNNQGGGYNNQPNNSGSGGYRNDGPIYKKSGCSYKENSRNFDGEVFPTISAWNVSKRRGFIKLIASPRKDPSKRKTKNPDFENWHASVQFADGKRSFNALYNLRNGKLTIPDLAMVCNPHAPSGQTRSGKTASGYFGTYDKK